MSDTNIWTRDGQTFSTTLAALQAAGGERKVTLPDSSLRVGDVDWKVVRQKDGTTAMAKSIPARNLVIVIG